MKHYYKLSWKFPQIAIVVLLLFCSISTAPAQTTLPAEDIAEKALAATVYLEMKDKNGKTLGIGSGFFVRHNLIATNYHVIEGAAKGTAKLVGKNMTFVIEGVSGTDAKNDLALLKIIMPGIKPPQDVIDLSANEIILEHQYGIKLLFLGNSDAVKIGATVYVAGNPKGLEGTFSDGIISSRRNKGTKERLQMTAPISPGSSGGPVLNKKGEVIGVSFMTIVGGQNLNFAIPSKYLKKLLAQPKIAKPLSQGKHSISAETYFLWANTKFDLREYVGAIANYTKVIQLEPDNANAYYNRGLAKHHLKRYIHAIPDYDTAIRLKPDYTDAYINRGIVKYKLKQYFGAIADYDTAIRLKPDNATAYYYRGLAKAMLKQYFAAIADYDIAIRLKPDSAKAYVSRGFAKAKLEQYFAAISDYNTAIRLKPDNATAYYYRGDAKMKLEQYFGAIADYDTAIHLKPDDAGAYFGRGVAKYALGHTREAKQDLQKALKLAEKTGDADLIYWIKKSLQNLR